jgi:O-antigen/teichoic acid export membrane protein
VGNDSKIKELLKHFSIYGLGSIAQAASSFLLIPIVTKYLLPEEYGIYTLVTLVGALASTIFYFGMTTALPRSYFDQKDDLAKNRVLSTALALVSIGAVCQIALGYFSSSIISLHLFGSLIHADKVVVMLIASAIAFLNTFFQTYFRLLNKSKLVITLGIVASLVNFFVAIIFLKTTSLRVWAPILSFTLGQVIVFLFSVFQVRSQILSGFDKAEASLMIKLGFPAILTSVAVTGMEWSDRFFINKFLSLSDVGVYSLAFKFGTIIGPLLIFPFVQIWNPLMMKYRESHDISLFFSRVFNYYFAACGLFILLFIATFSEVSALIIKNPDYHKAFVIIPIIMLSSSIYGSVNILSAGFFYNRNIKEIPLIYFVFSVISILLNYCLIPIIGYWGAALSNLLIYTLLPFVVYQRSKRYFTFSLHILRISSVLVSCIILSVAVIYAQNFVLFWRLTLKVMILIVGLLITSFLTLRKDAFNLLLRGRIREAIKITMN